MENNTQENKYLRAKERVEELKKFYNNLIAYIIVNAGLAALNYWQNQWAYTWFLWSVFGWGIGLAFHAAKAFQWNPLFNKDWEERKVKEFMDKDAKDSSGDRWE